MRYHCVRQHDITDCGPACLATVFEHYGFKTSISKIREAAGTDKHGTSVYGMVKAAEQFGFTAKGVEGDKNAFYSEFPLPAIAHVIVDGVMTHYVVIHKITRDGIIAADPGKGKVKYAPEEFFEVWTGALILIVPGSGFKKGNERQGTVSRFFKLLLPQIKLLFGIFGASLMITALGIMASFYFRLILDDIVPGSRYDFLTKISVGVILLYVFKILLEFLRNHLMLHLGQRLDIPLILGYYEHVLKLRMNFFQARKVGEIISRFADASEIRAAISGAALTIMIDTIMAVAGGVVLYLQNAGLFFVCVIMLVIYSAIVCCYHRPVKRSREKQMEENAKLTSFMVEGISGVETVKSFNAEHDVTDKVRTLFANVLKSIFRGESLLNGQQTLTNAVYVIGETVILWVGAVLVLNGDLTIGELITFNALLAYFVDPVKNLINLLPRMQTAIVAADRVGEILDLDPEIKENEERKRKDISLNAPIKISNLDFRYGTHRLILKDINLEIQPGEKIALVGESGSGKTTLVKLLMKLYAFERGQILFGSHDIQDISIRALRKRIAYISQDVFMFSGTVRENLLLGNDDIAQDEIIAVCKHCKADDFIQKLPMKYDSLLDENGSNLSGGQKQRLAIARALLKKPDILIMDEATSNLDSVTEKAIEKTIDSLSNGITTLIIAHRLSTVMHCDRIFVMENGTIIEEGTHAKLMKDKKTYYHLWKEQMLPSGDEQ